MVFVKFKIILKKRFFLFAYAGDTFYVNLVVHSRNCLSPPWFHQQLFHLSRIGRHTIMCTDALLYTIVLVA